jgi:hypothetical protein
MAANGTSRHFAAMPNLNAIGASPNSWMLHSGDSQQRHRAKPAQSIMAAAAHGGLSRAGRRGTDEEGDHKGRPYGNRPDVGAPLVGALPKHRES